MGSRWNMGETLTASIDSLAGNAVIRLTGALDVSTYRQARDIIVKAALDGHFAVIVDVDALDVRDDHAWSVFTSARWHVHCWPDVEIVLACADPVIRERLTRLSIDRYVPVVADVVAALAAIGDGTRDRRRRARVQLPSDESAIGIARTFICDRLQAWTMTGQIAMALTVATIFVENAIDHSDGGCDVRLEGTSDDIVVAVSDFSTAPAVRHEREPGSAPAGLDVVAAFCRHWGSTTTATGKTVWARIGTADPIDGVATLLR